MRRVATTIFGFGFALAVALQPTLSVAQKAPAAGGLLVGVDPGWVSTYLLEFGYDVELGTDEDDAPVITGDSLGADFIVNFDACSEGTDCAYMIFSYYWDAPAGVTDQTINDWNSVEWFGQAHMAEDGAVGISFAATFEGGVHQDNIAASIELWDEYVGYFEDHIGLNSAGDSGTKPAPVK